VFGITWGRLGSGLLAPCGSLERTQVATKDAHTFLSVKERAIALRKLYERYGIEIPDGSSLAKFLACGVRLSDEWLLGGARDLPITEAFNGTICSRIVWAALTLEDEPENIAKRYLEKLLRGSLDLIDRIDSEAKNFLWELEVFLALRVHGAKAKMAEPDLLVDSNAGPIGIACKKIYSEKNLSKVLSEGVRQIERTGVPGILALNLDEWAPRNSILKVNTFEELRWVCNQNNNRFLEEHWRHVDKYCSGGRAIGIWVSTAVIATVAHDGAGLSNAHQAILWFSTKMTPEKQAFAHSFIKLFPAS
jgi:hypothetical protein